MKDAKGITIREAIKLYYGEISLSDTEKKEIDEMLREIEKSGFLERCKEVASQSKKKKIQIGRLYISKVACMILVIFLAFTLTGGIVYATVLYRIQSIKVKDMGDHSELEIEYNDDSVTEKAQEKTSAIEIINYYEPTWIPDGYYKGTEYRHVMSFNIYYKALDFDDIDIYYTQYTLSSKHYYSTENGVSEQVSFEEYSGEYIETDDSNYLIVSDGTYIYSLIAQSKNVGKQELIKMIESMIEKHD